MRLMALTAAIFASAVPSSVLAQETPPPETQAAKPEKPVCKTVSTTGSRLRRTRYCMTAWEAKLDAEKSRRDVDQMRRRTDLEPAPATQF